MDNIDLKTINLQNPICISCKRETKIDALKDGKRPQRYDDCRYKCENCRIGYSNGKYPTAIYENYKDNIPNQLHDRLDDILDSSLNIKNRKNKKNKISFCTSEDALTWIFFSYFSKYEKTENLMEILGFDRELIDNIYFWGTAYKKTEESDSFRKQMEHILINYFNEKKKLLSEPDIIIKTKTKLIFCEIKLGSGNYSKKSVDKYEKYISNDYFSDTEKIHESKCYELIRNWSILNKISKGEKVYLFNIGINEIFDKEDSKPYLNYFIESINNKNAFLRKRWVSDIISRINKDDVEDWFYQGISQRISFVETKHR
jgi:hypothetical protein